MKISIITPIYNERKRIEEYLKRLEKQTVKPEIVLVDGGSTDGTVEFIKQYQKEHKNVKLYFETGKYRSPANARNIGKRKAKGSFIIFMDVDGYINNKAVEIIEKQAEKHPDAVALFFKSKPYPVKKFNSRLQRLFYCRDVLRSSRIRRLRKRKKDKYDDWFFVYNKDYFPEFDPILGFGEDRINAKKVREVFDKYPNRLYYSNDLIQYAQVGCSSFPEVFRRFKWYGRTIPIYLSKVNDRKVKYYYYAAILGIPFIFLYVIPLIRGIYFGIVLRRDCWWAIFILPLIEIIAFYSLMIGFYQRVFGNKLSGRE